ncbi:beta-lactamase family protein [Alphaproteobacteria bacterium]|nr:beta-lactamase family protein [Alphaproteobacteria bacterium]
MNKPLVSGYFDTKFKKLIDFINSLLIEGEEIGCSVTLFFEGKKIIDIWGGWQNSNNCTPWQHDTIVSTFSVSKALVSTLGHILVDKKIIDLDAKVSKYWPEFSNNGKDQILVRQLFSHNCALSFVDEQLKPGDLYDWNIMLKAIENTSPHWLPGTKPSYLNMTYGYLIGGLIYKTTGLKLSKFNRLNLSGPLNMDYNFALKSYELNRVATVYKKQADNLFENSPNKDEDIFFKSMQGFSNNEDFNSIEWRTGEVGSGQGHGNGRSIAILFEMLRNGGTFNGVNIISKETRDNAIKFQNASIGDDPILGIPIRFSLGYELNTKHFYMGPNSNSFGHWGAGGSFGFADIENKISFGYTPNLMHDKFELGPRGQKIINIIYNCF